MSSETASSSAGIAAERTLTSLVVGGFCAKVVSAAAPVAPPIDAAAVAPAEGAVLPSFPTLERKRTLSAPVVLPQSRSMLLLLLLVAVSKEEAFTPALSPVTKRIWRPVSVSEPLSSEIGFSTSAAKSSSRMIKAATATSAEVVLPVVLEKVPASTSPCVEAVSEGSSAALRRRGRKA